MDSSTLNRDSQSIRDTIVRGTDILVREGLIPNAGHISVRPDGADWFWTPRHVHVGLDSLGPADIIRCDMQGESLDPGWEASGERFIYTEIFSRRKEVRAIAHVHAPMAVAFSIAGEPLVPILMLAAHIGHVPIFDVPEPVEDTKMGEALADVLGDARAVLMRGHGVTVVGDSVEEVCAIAVLLEETARMHHMASQIGKPREIDTTGKEELYRAAFVHFMEVFWDHHCHRPRNSPHLGSLKF